MANINDEDFEDSDEDDEDFVPNEDLEDDSDDDILDVIPDDEENQPNPSLANGNGKKKTSKLKKPLNKKPTRGSFLHANDDQSDVDNKEIEEESVLPVNEKEKSDSLWADFLSDVSPPKTNSQEKSISKSQPQNVSEKEAVFASLPIAEAVPSKVKVTELFEFAGETVVVTKEVDSSSKEAKAAQTSLSNLNEPSKSSPLAGIKRSSAIGSVLGQLSGKKNKLSTLEKSKLDWNRFKEEEGIDEDLKTHNKGKEGYLEKLDFFERTDLRQFEVEKSLRAGNRKK